MEVVLLWLDDLDDVTFVLVSLWARLRRICLAVGLLAAFVLVACELSMAGTYWSLALAAIACASVALWTSGALLPALVRRLSQKPVLARA
jgi:hypothetical protein